MTFDEARNTLAEMDQAHILRFWETLDNNSRSTLLEQISVLDLGAVAKLMAKLAEEDQGSEPSGEIEPAAVIRTVDAAEADATLAGEALLRAGRVGVVLVAGGQGTRLGFDAPKGTYPIAPLSGASLFEIHSRKILALEQRYDAHISFYIMTSVINNDATVAFFSENDYFGLDPDRVRMFVQGTYPALTPESKLVLDRPDHVFVSPDGHGGTITALDRTGMLADMKNRGIDTLFYFQVDNPLVEIADPAFLGLHSQKQADMSVKVCAKRDATEGLGVVVERDGRLWVVEYTELTDKQKHETLDDGELRFKFGSVAIHIFSRQFLEMKMTDELPLHLAHKKVPYCDESGNVVKPTEPNAYKFEKFIFDALPDARNAAIVEFAREDEFSPLKNAEGNDSPPTVQRDMTRKAGRMLARAGVQVPINDDGTPAHKIEIDPCYAIDAADLKAKLPEGFEIDGDTYLK